MPRVVPRRPAPAAAPPVPAATRSRAAREHAIAQFSDAEREADAEASERTLSSEERQRATDTQRLSARTVYTVIRREGEEELYRPASSLWWSGVAAGIGISTSVLAEGILEATLADGPHRELWRGLGYTTGFVLVILSRLQLFTENTLSVVLPCLARPGAQALRRMLRLWVIVFAANMVGTFLTALLTLYGGTVKPEHLAGMLAVSEAYVELPAMEALVLGIPAGFFIAAVVWMLPSAKGFEIFVVVLFTYIIAIAGFTHVVAGSTEVFLLLLNGQIGAGDAVFRLIGPMLIGNVLGGTGLFALLAYAQVHEEV